MAMAPDDPTLLLMEHPTRGLDLRIGRVGVGPPSAVAQRGSAIVFASSDLDELLRYSDRIAVFFEGRIIAVVPAQVRDPVIPGSAHRWSDAVKRMRSVPLAIGIGIVATILLLLAVGPRPLEAMQVIFDGAFGEHRASPPP